MGFVDNDGEPGCKTAAEVHQRYRNNWDPTSYWQCGLQGEPAQLVRCETNKLYSDVAKECIHWKQWLWTDPKEPPSRPDQPKIGIQK